MNNLQSTRPYLKPILSFVFASFSSKRGSRVIIWITRWRRLSAFALREADTSQKEKGDRENSFWDRQRDHRMKSCLCAGQFKGLRCPFGTGRTTVNATGREAFSTDDDSFPTRAARMQTNLLICALSDDIKVVSWVIWDKVVALEGVNEGWKEAWCEMEEHFAS